MRKRPGCASRHTTPRDWPTPCSTWDLGPFADDLDSATALLQESLGNARVAGNRWLEAWALIFLAAAALARGAYGEAGTLA